MLLSTLLGVLPSSHHARVISGVARRAPVDPVVGRVTDRVQDVRPGDVFVAIKGARFDGHCHIPPCAAAVVERPVAAPEGVVLAQVESTVRALGPLCAATEGHPGDALIMVAVTGTNGKTSVSALVAHFARANGWSAGTIGTTGHMLNDELIGEGYTTPTAPQLQRLLATFRERGAKLVAMEVSSIGLAAHRVDGTRFVAAGYTNLTRDHLDFHGTMDAYAAAKARLFTDLLLPGAAAVLNRADPAVAEVGESLLAAQAALGPPPDSAPPVVRWFPSVTVNSETIRGMTITVHTADGPVATTTRLVGSYNRDNIACAWALANAAGIGHACIAAALPTFTGVPGRLERVSALDAPFDVFVDYAHTADALSRVLAVLRPLTAGRLLVVFGCGGDRDTGKRPEMGAASRLADLVFLTSDNPRSEAPMDIISAVLPGVGDHPCSVEPDRRSAIANALAAAAPGDVVLVAGKGHETTQTIGDQASPFDDRAVCRELLSAAPHAHAPRPNAPRSPALGGAS